MSFKYFSYAFTIVLLAFGALHQQIVEGTAQPMVWFQSSWNQTDNNGQTEIFTNYILAFSNRILNDQTQPVCYVRFRMAIPSPQKFVSSRNFTYIAGDQAQLQTANLFRIDPEQVNTDLGVIIKGVAPPVNEGPKPPVVSVVCTGGCPFNGQCSNN